LSWQPTVLVEDKIGCRLTRASNAETQLLGYITWQWDRYLVPQNVFLVWQRIQEVDLIFDYEIILIAEIKTGDVQTSPELVIPN